MLRRLAPAAVLPLALLAGCAGAGEPAQPAETITADRTESVPAQTTEPAAEPTEPAPGTTEANEDASPTAEATDESTDEATSGATAEVGDANPDLVDGVRTNDFGRMPKDLGGMPQKRVETNPQEHRAVFQYEREDNQASAQLMAYIPVIDGEPAPVFERGDEGYMTAVESAVLAMRENGEAEQRHVESGGLAWDCVEAPASQQGGQVDHALCVSHLYGRVLEVQTLSVHDDDPANWRTALDNVLRFAGEGFVAIKG